MLGKKLSVRVEELQRQYILKLMGLIDHKDLGIINGFYCDKVWKNEEEWIIIRAEKKKIDEDKDPCNARMENLRKEIKFWFDEMVEY